MKNIAEDGLNFLLIVVDFNCIEKEAKSFIEETRLAGKKVLVDMHVGSSSNNQQSGGFEE